MTCSQGRLFNPFLGLDTTSERARREQNGFFLWTRVSGHGGHRTLDGMCPSNSIIQTFHRIVPDSHLDGTLVVRSIDSDAGVLAIWLSGLCLGIVAMSSAPSSQPRATAGSTYSCSKLKLDSLFLRWFSLSESQQIVRFGRVHPELERDGACSGGRGASELARLFSTPSAANRQLYRRRTDNSTGGEQTTP